MDIRQLRLFCRIVDRRSFSLAADELHITQPAASQQVRSMERELKTTLLDRSRRTVVPTDAGCRVVWSTHAVHEDPSIDMEERLVDRQMEALQGLRDVLEGGAA